MDRQTFGCIKQKISPLNHQLQPPTFMTSHSPDGCVIHDPQNQYEVLDRLTVAG